MSADPRLVALRLAGSWGRKVELGELDIKVAWDLLTERIGATDPKFQVCPTCGMLPCGDPGYCASMRAADQKIAASRRCEQCKAGGGDLEPHRDNERRKVIYLHRGACERFWKSRHR